jgi:hypothetical protein
MKYEFEKVMDGISKYINNEIYSEMNDWQEFMARVMIGRIINNHEEVKEMLVNNGYIRTFGIIDSSGMVDVESLASDIKREIERKEKITFNLPLFGTYTFKPMDVDVLYRTITGKEMMNNEIN